MISTAPLSRWLICCSLLIGMLSGQPSRGFSSLSRAVPVPSIQPGDRGGRGVPEPAAGQLLSILPPRAHFIPCLIPLKARCRLPSLPGRLRHLHPPARQVGRAGRDPAASGGGGSLGGSGCHRGGMGIPPWSPKSSPPRATPAAPRGGAGWAQEPAPWLTGCPRGQRWGGNQARLCPLCWPGTALPVPVPVPVTSSSPSVPPFPSTTSFLPIPHLHPRFHLHPFPSPPVSHPVPFPISILIPSHFPPTSMPFPISTPSPSTSPSLPLPHPCPHPHLFPSIPCHPQPPTRPGTGSGAPAVPPSLGPGSGLTPAGSLQVSGRPPAPPPAPALSWPSSTPRAATTKASSSCASSSSSSTRPRSSTS